MTTAEIQAVHPVLAARDIPESIAYFARLGFDLAFIDDRSVPRYAVVIRDRCELHLQWHDASQWGTPRDRPVYRFYVSDVDGLFHELCISGVAPDPSTPPSPWAHPARAPWGTREFHLEDPAGNSLQFYRSA